MKYRVGGFPQVYEGQVAARKAAIDYLRGHLRESIPITTSEGVPVGLLMSKFDLIDLVFRYSMHYADGVVIVINKDGTRNVNG